MSEFLAMGGYAAYVWSAFGLTFAVMAINVIAANRRHRKMLREIQRVHGS
jgi:heme exporter protein D